MFRRAYRWFEPFSAGFAYSSPVENLSNTDLTSGHGTLVSGIIGGNGSSSNGNFAGVASGATVLGLSAGEANLMFVLAGFDYLLDRGGSSSISWRSRA